MSVIEKMKRLLYTCDIETKAEVFIRNMLMAGIAIALGVTAILLNFSDYSNEISVAAGIVSLIIFGGVVYASLVVRANNRIAEIEEVLPDFLSLMGSNLRSGLTPDRAFILSVRDEFGPLEKEVDLAAKQIVSGKSFSSAFRDMAERIDSEIFAKAVRLIIEGVRSGGNLADLLENTALDIRRFSAVRKEIVATVRVYELFIIAAAAVGAPLLYGVASFLVDIISKMRETLNLEEAMAATSTYFPIFSGGAGALSPFVIVIFAIVAIILTAFFGALTAGVISRGKESSGYVYVPVMLASALAIFFLVKFLLGKLMGGYL